ncbi:sensor histidine kinase [Bacillus sp. MUM 116]|uniref:cache domain-containing sensor histidine kinase n=1 Tax=Bacillus sp. MUM 116 TaxID=1678002 RepID=UPI000AF2F81B|nr:sensor histidine kinase [Bacillus sp. MUM 116]
MRLLPERFKQNGLLMKMFLITMVIIIIVSTTIAWTTIHMAEQFFFQRFSIMNEKVMSQVKDRFEAFNYSIVTAANNILESGTIRSVFTEKQTAVQQMTSFYTMGQQLKHIQSNLDPYEVEIILLGRNGVSFRTDRNVWTIPDQELKKSILVRNTLEQPKKLMFQYDQRPKTETGDKWFIVASKALMDRISGIVYGSMYVGIKESEFRQFYSNYTSPGNHVFLVDKSGAIVSSDEEKLIGEKSKELLGYADKLKDQSHHYIVGKFMGKNQIILMDYLPTFDMYLFNVIDKQTAFGDLINKKEIALVAMAIVLLALIIVFLASRRLTNSLSSLVKQIGSAPKYDFDKYVSVSGTYETRQIGNAFNSMLDELHEYVEQLILSQKEKRNAELAALQQQINPHFLYNTLTTIKFMVNQGEKQETEATINALISLLQNTIGNVSETITVKQEIENLKNYVLINQKRYGDRIKVNYFLAPDCMDFQIPKLILQPFMENSFFHGFNRKAEGYINVLVWRDGDHLICEVVDNGDGLEVEADNKFPNTKRNQQLFSGIGVRNVHERIQLIYGEGYGVAISSEPGNGGTKVRIILPIHSK